MRAIGTTILAAALITGGSAMLAAPGQTTARPGDPTQARVWIENRGKNEAIPVDLRDANLEVPLRVQVMNGDTQSARPIPPLPVRSTLHPWEYRTVTVKTTDDPAKELNPEGLVGWETTGITWLAAGGTTLLLKRPR
jgi:hypothetical protein